MPEIDLKIRPSEKYREVIRGEYDGEVPDTDAEYREESDHHEAADAYAEAMAEAPTAEEMGMTRDELDPLTWDDIGVSRDAELVSQMATYFDGMDSDEDTERLRSKLRLLDVDTYAKVQFAAQTEQRQAA